MATAHGTRSNFGLESYGTLCDACGIPLDAEHFDRAHIEVVHWPDLTPGRTLSLTEFQLRPQYCGILDCFSQFTDRWAKDQEYRTPGLRWSVRVDGRPLFPYEDVRDVINPWGYGSFPVRIRLPEAARVEVGVRRVAEPGDETGFTQIGARIAGRYWYNPAYGGKVDRCA